jgi:hypothetical protein
MMPGIDCLWHRNLSTVGRVKHYYQIFISDPDVNICDYKLQWPEHTQGNHCICELASKSILWYIDVLLGNDRETHNKTVAIARQFPMSSSGSIVFYVVHSEALWLDQLSSIQLVSAVHLSTVQWNELVQQAVRGLLQFSCHEPFLLDTSSWGTGIVREPRVRELPPWEAVIEQWLVKTQHTEKT